MATQRKMIGIFLSMCLEYWCKIKPCTPAAQLGPPDSWALPALGLDLEWIIEVSWILIYELYKSVT